MNSGQNTNQDGADQEAGGIGLEDIYYTIFRHKWMILAFLCAGVVAALLVPIVKPAPYVSWVKVMVPYVVNSKSAAAITGSAAEITPTAMPGQGAIASEVEILKSANVATKAAEVVGPAKILAKFGGGSDVEAAAGVVLAGIDVENPRGTDILVISFKHPDRRVAQETLSAVLAAYKKHNLEVRMGGSEMDEYFQKQIDQEQVKLTQTDKQLKDIKAASKIVSVDETKKAYQAALLKWEEDLRVAEGELAERTAIHPNDNPNTSVTNLNSAMPPADKIEEYTTCVSELEQSKKSKRELISQRHYTEMHPLVLNAQASIAKQQIQKVALEKEYPALAGMSLNVSRSGTNSVGADMVDDLSSIRKLTARVTYINTVISNIQAQASAVLDKEADIKALERKQSLTETNIFSLSSAIQQSLVTKNLSAVNETVRDVQSATPAARDMKKLRKLIGGAFVGVAGLGLLIAFLLDFVVNRTIRRSADIERQLHLPVFLTIPDTKWSGKLRLPWKKGEPSTDTALAVAGDANSETAMVPWGQGEQLDTYLEGLKERLMTYFEVHNLNMKKPKLVGVTGCDRGAGVSTVASGLAAALSNAGNGSVLLVDMNKGQGLAQSFTKGEITQGLTQVLEAENRDNARVQDNLYVATVDREEDGSLAKSLPSKFNKLVPKLKASDYDYIIFDMPPVTQTSATPRLASYMDITLMVMESEKTGQQMASRASALMRTARANVAAVLNKYRPHVPARLSHEL